MIRPALTRSILVFALWSEYAATTPETMAKTKDGVLNEPVKKAPSGRVIASIRASLGCIKMEVSIITSAVGINTDTGIYSI